MTATVIPIVLNNKNYKDWSFRMETYFLAKDLWDIVRGTVKEPPEGEEHKAWKKKDAKALYAIQNSCGDYTYKLIEDLTTAEKAWNRLSFYLKQDESASDDESARKTVGEVYPNGRESTLEEGCSVTGGHDESGETADTLEHNFVKYVESNDWDNAVNFLRQHPQAGGYRIPRDYGTALHYAIEKRCSVRIIQQLVELMPMEHLQIQDRIGCTALYRLIMRLPEMVQVAERIVKKSHNLLTILPSWDEAALVVMAQGHTKGERMARYLYSLTPPETMRVMDAAQLISHGFHLQKFDIMWDLIQRYPQLAMTKDRNGDFPLATLASNCFAFKSGSQLSLWEKLIYYG